MNGSKAESGHADPDTRYAVRMGAESNATVRAMLLGLKDNVSSH